MEKENQKTKSINAYRRNLLKFAAVGGGAFLIGKFLGPLINTLQGERVLNETVFENFKLVETGKNLKVMDRGGDEILVIDKESF